MAATASPATPNETRAAAEAFAALPPRIVFFDGVCGFCDGTVKWLIANDPDERLHFAPLQGETAAIVRAAFPGRFPEDIDTFVFFEPSVPAEAPEARVAGRQISLRSSAIFALAADLGGRLHWVARLRWIPRWLTDIAYRLFAANRYRMFGQLDACDIPTPADRARLLP